MKNEIRTNKRARKPRTLRTEKISKKMAVERNKPDHQPHAVEPHDQSLDDDWFADAETQVTQPGWVVLKANIDRDLVDWFRSRWTDYRSSINQVLRAYMDQQMKVVIPIEEYRSDRAKVVGKYDPAVVRWVRSQSDSDGFMSLVLRDFMLRCLEEDQQKSKTG